MIMTGTARQPDLATGLRISVSRLARRLRAEQASPGPGEPTLSDTQFAALAALERHGAMTPGELASHEKVQPPSMTRVIGVLADAGLITRCPDARDRRQVVLAVTEAGRGLVNRTRRKRDAWLARQLAQLTPQERAALRAAVGVLEKLSQS
jgi:DNA-binding MarR family transcriptional regulator